MNALSTQRSLVQNAGINMAWSALKPAMAQAETKAFISGIRLAQREGSRAGCRGQLTCMRAVGLYWGTQSGKTEDVAGQIAEAVGLEAQDASEASVADMTGY